MAGSKLFVDRSVPGENLILREHGSGSAKRTELLTAYKSSSGISIHIGKTAGTLYISGWYDSMVGIEGMQVPLRTLLDLFPKATLRRAMKDLL